MTITLVVPHSIAEDLERVARLPIETAGVMYVSVVDCPSGDIRLLVRQMRWVPDDSYTRREWNGMTIRSDGFVPYLGEAESLGTTCLWVHTHPGQDARPLPSVHDRLVDDELAPLFRLRAGTPHYGAVIFSAHREGLAFTGNLVTEGHKPAEIARMWQVGDRFRLVQSYGRSARLLSAAFDRSVRAFGAAVQQTLSEISVGIVGCGGTGSVVSEQLVRLGVRHLMLIDPDQLTESNLTRVYGSRAVDVGRYKVDVLSEHLARIAPDLLCSTVQAMVTMQGTARRLLDCDVVFGCTDDNAGRLVLSRLASFLLTPIIDCGVLLSSSSDDHLTGIDARVTVLAPGYACLVCRGRIDLSRAAAELLTPFERLLRQEEGYAPALGRIEPAVVSYTTFAGAAAINELLERLVGYGPTPRPSEVLLRCHDREISTNVMPPLDGHYCHPITGKLGIGSGSPFLGQTWPE